MRLRVVYQASATCQARQGPGNSAVDVTQTSGAAGSMTAMVDLIRIGQTAVLGCASPEADPETGIQGQVIYLGGNPRRHGQGARK